MKRTFITILSALLKLALFSLLLYAGRIIGIAPLSPRFGYGTAFAQENGILKVVFKVNCYDEGKAALRGLRGIQKIETGFHFIHETDTVYYDPKVISIEQMESALKKAGTYEGTINEKERN